jgi:chorismate mutase
MIPGSTESLDQLRGEIDRLDQELVELIAERVQVAHRAWLVKRGAGLPRLDPEREAAVVRRAVARARAMGLPAQEVRGLFRQLIALTRSAQSEEGARGRRVADPA